MQSANTSPRKSLLRRKSTLPKSSEIGLRRIEISTLGLVRVKGRKDVQGEGEGVEITGERGMECATGDFGASFSILASIRSSAH